MADISKILKRLESEYEYIKTFNISTVKEPVYFACNMNEKTFHIVGIYMDSEIGGAFTVDDKSFMEYVYENFDAHQAEDLIEIIIGKIKTGEANILNAPERKTMH